MEVKFPEARTELGSYLEDLANPLFQWETWIEKNPRRPKTFGFDSSAYFMLDDPWLQGDTRDDIGGILKTEDEAEAIAKLIAALKAVIEAVGKTSPDRNYLVHPLWADVLVTAREALDAFTRAEYGYPVKHQLHPISETSIDGS